jgi:hypothetical protein
MPEYKLIPEQLPTAGRRGGASVYVDMVEQFLKMSKPSVRVQYDRKPSTIYVQLKRVVRSDPRYAGVKVSQRDKNVYLVREER